MAAQQIKPGTRSHAALRWFLARPAERPIREADVPADFGPSLPFLVGEGWLDYLDGNYWASQAARLLAEGETRTKKMTVDLDRMTATLDGVAHDVDSERALRWLKVLAENPGVWISAPKMRSYDKLLTDVRPDRHCKPYLPDEILALIDSDRHKGCRLRLP